MHNSRVLDKNLGEGGKWEWSPLNAGRKGGSEASALCHQDECFCYRRVHLHITTPVEWLRIHSFDEFCSTNEDAPHSCIYICWLYTAHYRDARSYECFDDKWFDDKCNALMGECLASAWRVLPNDQISISFRPICRHESDARQKFRGRKVSRIDVDRLGRSSNLPLIS